MSRRTAAAPEAKRKIEPGQDCTAHADIFFQQRGRWACAQHLIDAPITAIGQRIMFGTGEPAIAECVAKMQAGTLTRADALVLVERLKAAS